MIVGNIARLSDVKGQDVLIQAMAIVTKSLPDAILIIIGVGKMEDELKALVKDLDLDEIVKFFPSVNKTLESLSVFDVFVMPSRQEGLGLSIMEAMAMELPVVASNVGGIPNLIKDGKTGILVTPENAVELAAGIVKILENPVLSKEIGTEGRRFIKENCSSQSMVNQTLKVYEKVISE